MKDLETVKASTTSSQDPLVSKQREDVAKMRASLLCCSDDPFSASNAIRNITVLRIYHQLNRIIRYLEMMDKIEDKLYRSIDSTLETLEDDDPTTWMRLITLQEKLQKNLIESHKLLEPYLDIPDLHVDEISPKVIESIDNSQNLLDKDARDRIRTSAQQVLSALGPIEG